MRYCHQQSSVRQAWCTCVFTTTPAFPWLPDSGTIVDNIILQPLSLWRPPAPVLVINRHSHLKVTRKLSTTLSFLRFPSSNTQWLSSAHSLPGRFQPNYRYLRKKPHQGVLLSLVTTATTSVNGEWSSPVLVEALPFSLSLDGRHPMNVGRASVNVVVSVCVNECQLTNGSNLFFSSLAQTKTRRSHLFSFVLQTLHLIVSFLPQTPLSFTAKTALFCW